MGSNGIESAAEVIKTLKSGILKSASPTYVDYGGDAIEKVIPHRSPFRLIDRINVVDLTRSLVSGKAAIDHDDPVLTGHFPNNPLYPGVLQLELIGQLGLCLAHFVRNVTTRIDERSVPVRGRLTKVLGAGFALPVKPKDELDVVVQMLSCDDFFGRVGGQIICNEQVCSYGVLEVYFDE